jgi:hypothetical protein
MVVEKATGQVKVALLPFDVQIHRSPIHDEYFIVNAFRLISSEQPESSKSNIEDRQQSLHFA